MHCSCFVEKLYDRNAIKFYLNYSKTHTQRNWYWRSKMHLSGSTQCAAYNNRCHNFFFLFEISFYQFAAGGMPSVSSIVMNFCYGGYTLTQFEWFDNFYNCYQFNRSCSCNEYPWLKMIYFLNWMSLLDQIASAHYSWSIWFFFHRNV